METEGDDVDDVITSLSTKELPLLDYYTIAIMADSPIDSKCPGCCTQTPPSDCCVNHQDQSEALMATIKF